MIEIVDKEDCIENKGTNMDKTLEEWTDWVSENGDMLGDILGEIDDFIYDIIYSEENEWIDTDLDELTGFVLFTLYHRWLKDHEVD